MAFIYETKNFNVNAFEKPHISREEGGHIIISPKIRVYDRTKLSPKLLIEVTRLSVLIGEAMVLGLKKNGIDIGRINYQDNGNWSVFKPEGPYFHLHLYGRAKDAKIQKYGDALFAPNREKSNFYDSFLPLNEKDISLIQDEIKILLKEDRFKTEKWRL